MCRLALPDRERPPTPLKGAAAADALASGESSGLYVKYPGTGEAGRGELRLLSTRIANSDP